MTTFGGGRRRRRPELDRWPRGTEPPGAAVFAHNVRVIAADGADLWRLLVAAEDWPRWYPNARQVEVADGTGRLGPDAAFRWRTFGVTVHSQVVEYAPPEHLGWIWWATGLHGYHGWRLDDHAAGTRVITEETQRGPRASRLALPLTVALSVGHWLWLAGLAAQVSRSSGPGEPEP